MAVQARITVDGRRHEFTADERIVVKLRTADSKTQEVSTYIQDDGRMDCRYFEGTEVGGMPIWEGMMYDDGLVVKPTMSDAMLRQIRMTMIEARGQAYFAWLNTTMGTKEDEVAFKWMKETYETCMMLDEWLEEHRNQLYTALKAEAA